jgi:predicted GNAT family N-acyltransferase
VIEQVDWQRAGERLLRLRTTVFVDEQGVPPTLEHDAHDSAALHLLASTQDGTAVGTARLLANGHIGRMAVLPGWRGRGIGSALLRHLLDIARERGLTDVFLHAQCQAEGFYRRHGFVAEGEIFLDAGIQHRRMRHQFHRLRV